MYYSTVDRGLCSVVVVVVAVVLVVEKDTVTALCCHSNTLHLQMLTSLLQYARLPNKESSLFFH